MKSRLGFAFFALTSCGFAQYTGPAILSRGDAPAAMSAAQIDFRPYADLMGVYDTGIAGIAVSNEGTLPNVGSAGILVGWGVSGTHSWRHTKVGLDYRGSLTHYAGASFYDTTDQSLLLGVNHQLTRHAAFSLRESAGMYTRNFVVAGLSQTVPFDPIGTNIPTADFFDNRVMYLSTQADLLMQKSARLSFDFAGEGFIVRRRSTALSGVVGAGARGDMQYRLTSRTTIGADYRYDHYDYTRIFGGTDTHVVTGSYSTRLTRNLEFSGFAGAMRVESKFVQYIPIDPAIASLLGISSAPQAVHTIRTVPTVSARISRKYGRGVAYLSGGHTVTPGNGLFLTSYTTNAVGGYTYTGMRRWSFSSNAGYNRSEAVGQIAGMYGGLTGALTASRQITGSIHMLVQARVNRYNSGSYAAYNRWTSDFRIGFGFTPGEIPLRVW